MGNISSRVPLLKRKAAKGSKKNKAATAPSTTVAGDSSTTVHSKKTPVSPPQLSPPLPLPAPSTSPEYDSFLQAYSHFSESAAIDELRARDFTRLSRNAVYLDYMGGGQHPESLVKQYAEALQRDVFGNTHSESMRYVHYSHPTCFFSITSQQSVYQSCRCALNPSGLGPLTDVFPLWNLALSCPNAIRKTLGRAF